MVDSGPALESDKIVNEENIDVPRKSNVFEDNENENLTTVIPDRTKMNVIKTNTSKNKTNEIFTPTEDVPCPTSSSPIKDNKQESIYHNLIFHSLKMISRIQMTLNTGPLSMNIQIVKKILTS